MFSRLLILFALLLCSFTELYAFEWPWRKKVRTDTLAVACRGVMETFPKVGDGIENRLDFYKSNGFTHYFYSPSDDRYCNSWGWKFVYNDSDRKELRDLREKCSSSGLEFVWTVRPGNDCSWDRKDYDFLLNKLVMMYYGGFRTFAVCLPENYDGFHSIGDSLEVDFVRKNLKGASVRIMNETPSVMFPSEEDAARTLIKGYHLDKDFCTSVLNADALVCVLREQTELSAIALATVADCASNPREHDSLRGLSKGIDMLSPDVKEPLMTFLEHTGGDDESESTDVFTLSEWTQEKADMLHREFVRIERVPAEMATCSSPALLESLDPWLEQFGRLGRMGRGTLECLEYYKKGDIGSFWIQYMDMRISEEEMVSFEHYKVGTRKLYPFCKGMIMELAEAFASDFTSGGVVPDSVAVDWSAAFDSDFSSSLSTSGHLTLDIPGNVNTFRLLTGRLPVRDKVIFRQLGSEGELLAEFVLKSAYSEFDIKTGTVKVDVIGDIDIYEGIFLSL